MENFKFDVKKCIEAKKKLNKYDITKRIYKLKCSYPHFLGNCTNLYHKLKPTDYYDFYDKELKYAEENHDLPIEDRGLTYEEFYFLAYKYKVLVENECKLKYSLSTYFYALVCHAIIETFVGQKKEENVMKYIEQMGFTAKKVDGEKDAKYGVDIEVFNSDKHFYVQVKPISFFVSNYNDTQEDRISCCWKREEILRLENLDTYYIIYDMNWDTLELNWLLNKNNGILFKINDLFQYDKSDIKGTIVRMDLPTERINTLI